MYQNLISGLFTRPSKLDQYRSKSFRRSAETVFLHGSAGRCGGAEIQFPHSGTAVKPYPGETFRSADFG